ncbi:serine/threonine-protein kinase, partial [Roseisolibacter sp. H3M3-2]|uniref:serine/threonine-protein kinase n=1 Tax=Roseisolibacter sp. H3M3-2 TaxID=3031323 RepID=UPI0023DA2F03
MPIPFDQLPPAARRLTDRFEFLEELGRGGMAEVYLARPLEGGEPVAVKLVAAPYAADPEAAGRFAREARTVASLAHPNLVRNLGVVDAPDGRTVAIVSAYVRGRTLRAVLRERGALPFDEAAAVLRDVAAGLAHAHAARIVHRDVKPENVFLEDDSGRALLADFGIARPIDAETQLTMVGSSLGTPTYMAPEQVDGGAVDARADVYALGLVGWEMLSGRRPWAGESLYALLHKQKHEPLPDLGALRPDVPAFLLRAIEGALAKDPARRWRDAGELLDRLSPRPAPAAAPDPDAWTDAATLRRVPPPAPQVAVAPPAPEWLPDAPLPALAAAPWTPDDEVDDEDHPPAPRRRRRCAAALAALLSRLQAG